VEADFQREYRIDLIPALDSGMTWRRFCALVTGLSGDSALSAVNRASSGTSGGSGKLITDPKASERAFRSLMAPVKKEKT
jgi:hypothetical protein